MRKKSAFPGSGYGGMEEIDCLMCELQEELKSKLTPNCISLTVDMLLYCEGGCCSIPQQRWTTEGSRKSIKIGTMVLWFEE